MLSRYRVRYFLWILFVMVYSYFHKNKYLHFRFLITSLILSLSRTGAIEVGPSSVQIPSVRHSWISCVVMSRIWIVEPSTGYSHSHLLWPKILKLRPLHGTAP